MRNRQLFILLLPILLMTGCSWMAEVLVFNKSQHTAAVTFSFRDGDFPDAGYYPKAYKVERWESDTIPVMFDTAAVYWRAINDSTWYVELPPNTALVFAEGLNLDMRDDGQLDQMLSQSKSLQVMMPNDANFSCGGTACRSSMHRFSRGRAGIIVE